MKIRPVSADIPIVDKLMQLNLSLCQVMPDQDQLLMDMAIRSEGYWGFGVDMLNRYRERHPFDKAFMNHYKSFWMVDGADRRIGFFSVAMARQRGDLDGFYIDPDHIGKGYGKVMWQLLMQRCSELGIEELTFKANPEAKAFYEKQGAMVIDEVESEIMQGRMLPVMQMTVRATKK